MPEFPISSARILLVSQIQGGGAVAPPFPPVRYAYELLIPELGSAVKNLSHNKSATTELPTHDWKQRLI